MLTCVRACVHACMCVCRCDAVGDGEWGVHVVACQPADRHHLQWGAQCSVRRVGFQCRHGVGPTQCHRAQTTSVSGWRFTVFMLKSCRTWLKSPDTMIHLWSAVLTEHVNVYCLACINTWALTHETIDVNGHWQHDARFQLTSLIHVNMDSGRQLIWVISNFVLFA